MKQIFTLLLFSALLVNQLQSQPTGSFNFVIDIVIDNQVTTFERGPCGFEAPNEWGGPIDSNFCLPIVWGYTATDSFGCEMLADNYNGKAAMLRRRYCEFGFKSLMAQQAGAEMAIIANGYDANYGNACAVANMDVASADPFVTIPAVFFCRKMVDLVDNALKAGIVPNACFRLLPVYKPTAEYAYATPVAQADTMDLISCRVVNRGTSAQTFTVRAAVAAPDGSLTEFSVSEFVGYKGDSLIVFPAYVPPQIEGKFSVMYTVDGQTEPGDTIFREFELTKYTFATDNLTINGSEVLPQFTTSNTHSNASLYRTGDQVFNAGWISFGLHNPATLASGTSTANQIQIMLLDADPDKDGKNNLHPLTGSFPDLPLVAYQDFTIDASLQPDAILYVPLIPVSGDSVLLQPNHFYYIRILHDDPDDNQFLSFTTSSKVQYRQFNGVGPVTPLELDIFDAQGWADRTVINRLVDAAFKPEGSSVVKTTPLDRSKYKLSPNPAGSETTLQLDLATPNKSVDVLLIGMKGEIISKQTFKNFLGGQVRLVTNHLPSGNYGLLIRASEEGVGMVNLVVGH